MWNVAQKYELLRAHARELYQLNGLAIVLLPLFVLVFEALIEQCEVAWVRVGCGHAQDDDAWCR